MYGELGDGEPIELCIELATSYGRKKLYKDLLHCITNTSPVGEFNFRFRKAGIVTRFVCASDRANSDVFNSQAIISAGLEQDHDNPCLKLTLAAMLGNESILLQSPEVAGPSILPLS
jgi:hypothetical protein